MNYLKKYLAIISVTLFPYITHAQFVSSDADSLVTSITGFINKSVIPVIVLLALVYVMHGIVVYIKDAGDSKEKEDQKQKIFWGIIGLFIILSIWAIVFTIANTFGIKEGGDLGGILN